VELKFNNQLISLRTPIVMGILNVTPDSFFKGNRFVTEKQILLRAEEIVSQGATIIDIGGYSTRPNAEQISIDEEINRVSRALAILLKQFPSACISVDTFRSSVARHVVKEFHVGMINDVGGGTLDDMMFETIADLDVAYVLMHMRGNPQNMQQFTDYQNIISDIISFFVKRVARLRLLGVKDILIDPGFGFAKTLDQNYLLLRNLKYLGELQLPVLAGISRKSMIYNLINSDARGALNATTAAHLLALAGGANVLRVHDVKEAVECIQIYTKYNTATLD
jgi:dihydropteroate synthase